ncbi:uncharacterized protein [Nicotiana tomentosiformis]|uniref:uncharacterized protein n=1 Tax=Nicotiana tomentosiformis TaxID=4098 RepID=UPI00388CAFF0
MVADVLSRKAESLGILEYLPAAERLLVLDGKALANQFVRLDILEPSRVLACVVSRSSLYDRIEERQYDDLHLLLLKDRVQHDDAKEVTIGDDSVLRMHGRLCVPSVDGLRELILQEAHSSRYQSGIQMVPYEALYVMRCRSLMGWFEPGEARLLGTDLVQDALEKVKLIQDQLRTIQSRHKSYADRKVRDVGFIVGERVLLWVLPMKGVIRFGMKGKLSPRYIGPFEILKRIGEIAYKLALPTNQAAVHPVFHVSMHRKYHGDPYHVLDFSSVQLDKDLSYGEESMAILDRQVQKLRSENIALVKV